MRFGRACVISVRPGKAIEDGREAEECLPCDNDQRHGGIRFARSSRLMVVIIKARSSGLIAL